jgi:GcvH upstream region-like protein
MLSFFRKYQRYIYLVVTVVIIISFSFFGTYSTLGSNNWREQLAFEAVNGDEITRSDVDDMSHFLATDNTDKVLSGGAWGPNFLNDGVIRKDFLETGLAQELMLAYSSDIKNQLLKKSEKEKRFQLYSHPQAPFIGLEQAWTYFAPDMKANFNILRTTDDPTSPDAINSRVHLYLTQQKYPSSTLRQILRYQEQQFDWLTPDYSLANRDLSVFGYHTLNDWFGPEFSALVSQFIINAAILAEAKGYTVSKAEAIAELAKNTQVSFKENLKNPNLGVASPQEYFSEQLRWLNMDQARAIKIWQQVLLFRRYFQDAGSSAIVDTLAFTHFNQFANATVTADVYRLPDALRLNNYKALQKLDVYLKAVAGNSNKDPLALPEKFLSIKKVSESYPELVQKRYALEVTQADQKTLQSKIAIKDLWAWETEDKNWEFLRTKFPALGVKSGATLEERYEALEDLDANTRTRLDAFAKKAIVNSHPEWIEQALLNAQPKKMVVGIRIEGNKSPFDGLDTRAKREAFIELLDNAPIGKEPNADSPLFTYTADQQVYYRIRVLDRLEEPEIVAFAEANNDDTLDNLVDRTLEKYYIANREKNPTAYQQENKEWKSFKSVRDQVADEYFGNLWKKIEPIKNELAQNDPIFQSLGKDQLAALRFYPYLKQIKNEIEADADKADLYVAVNLDEAQLDQLPKKVALKDQWRITKEKVTYSRQDSVPSIDIEEALALNPQSWSSLKVPFNGDLVFFQVLDKGIKEGADSAVVSQTRDAQSVLSASAQRALMQKVLDDLKAKNAISLAYLKTPAEETAPMEPELGSQE